MGRKAHAQVRNGKNLVEKGIYPEENKFKKSYVRKQKELDKKIKSGEVKLRTFRNFAEFDHSIR